MNIVNLTISLSILLISLSSRLSGETRSWQSNDGVRSIQAEFISRDHSSVTLKKPDGRIITISLKKLHDKEQSFLDKNHPHQAPTEQKEPEGDAFGPLRFGDSRAEVEKKLLNSSIVTTNTNKTLFGRTGLNGTFKTTETIGGLHCFLFFDWSESGNLLEVTLRTKPLADSAYDNKLRKAWLELINLFNLINGKALSESPFPSKSELQDGLMLGSHLWRTDDGYSVLLGPAQEQSGYSINVRITTKRVEATVTIP